MANFFLMFCGQKNVYLSCGQAVAVADLFISAVNLFHLTSLIRA